MKDFEHIFSLPLCFLHTYIDNSDKVESKSAIITLCMALYLSMDSDVVLAFG